MNILTSALINFGKKLLVSALTEKFLAFITFKTAKAFAAKTKNTTDDEIIQELEDAYKGTTK